MEQRQGEWANESEWGSARDRMRGRGESLSLSSALAFFSYSLTLTLTLFHFKLPLLVTFLSGHKFLSASLAYGQLLASSNGLVSYVLGGGWFINVP